MLCNIVVPYSCYLNMTDKCIHTRRGRSMKNVLTEICAVLGFLLQTTIRDIFCMQVTFGLSDLRYASSPAELDQRFSWCRFFAGSNQGSCDIGKRTGCNNAIQELVVLFITAYFAYASILKVPVDTVRIAERSALRE